VLSLFSSSSLSSEVCTSPNNSGPPNPNPRLPHFSVVHHRRVPANLPQLSPAASNSIRTLQTFYNHLLDIRSRVFHGRRTTTRCTPPTVIMASTTVLLGYITDWKFLFASAVVYAISAVFQSIWFHPLSHVPGPKFAAATHWYHSYWHAIKKGHFVPYVLPDLHQKYGMYTDCSSAHDC
jgi:hypothetical protein